MSGHWWHNWEYFPEWDLTIDNFGVARRCESCGKYQRYIRHYRDPRLRGRRGHWMEGQR